MPQRLRQRGITLIEVLMALLIFSIGLMGVAALFTLSARSVHAAYLRTQVTFLAQNMADRMQANSVGVWKGYYNGTYPGAKTQRCAAGCTPPQLASRDQALWSSQLATFLPAGASANIACDPVGLAYTPTPEQIGMRPPYGGSCMMTITWPERAIGADGRGGTDPVRQTFAWSFQP